MKTFVKMAAARIKRPFSGHSLLVVLVLISVLSRECRSSTCSGSTCKSCISTGYSCSWCTLKDFDKPRCDFKENLISAGCPEKNIDDPQGSLNYLENSPVRDSTTVDAKAVQIQPQRLKISTRPWSDNTFTLTFRAANNFPVDLYFLFDNSVSMNSTIRSLGKLADDIGQAIGDISSNYRMGYGVFQDKVILPFTDTSPQKRINPCIGATKGATDCAPPFEFRHLLNMSSDLEEFKRKIHDTKLTGNLDHPEGSLDAILQAVTCGRQLGWREESRKLLIFASNGPFKTAGAGRLAGIVTPNDGSCHLDNLGEYHWQLKQDYPSVSQLTSAVDRHETHIIFAVTGEQRDVFEKLSDRITHSVVELLGDRETSNNQNIKKIIEEKYKEMISAVEIVYENVAGVDIKVRAMSDACQIQGTNKCKGLKIGTEIKFGVDIKVTECPKKPEDRRKKVILHPDFLKKDVLILDIEIICDCGCMADPSGWDIDSPECTNGNGTVKCGICDCKTDRFGEFCQCDSSELDSRNSNCRQPNTNTTVCNGAGVCKCDICDCDEGFSGPYCECNDQTCEIFDREVCGGGSRGRCVCGKCECEKGFEGSACECPTTKSPCMQNGEVCSGMGECVCGKCQCDKKYTGTFCQNCFLCGEDPCDVETYRTCAQCTLVDATTTDCSSLGCPPTQLVSSLDDVSGKLCSIKQSDGCFLQFVTEASESNITLYVQRTKTCPQPVNIIPIIAGLISGVVGVGILLLILWKILTTFFDKIEYSRFQEEVKNCKWAQQDNPFYKGATTTYKNPMLDTSQPLD